MTDDPQKRADALFAEAREATGARDPRPYYRDRLRELKRRNPEAYREAADHYLNKLIPSIVQKDEDPVRAWQAYGLLLADLVAPGRPVAVGPDGRSRPFAPPGESTDMVLHVPTAAGERLVLVGLPPEPSQAQMATYRWLVTGSRQLSSGP